MDVMNIVRDTIEFSPVRKIPYDLMVPVKLEQVLIIGEFIGIQIFCDKGAVPGTVYAVDVEAVPHFKEGAMQPPARTRIQFEVGLLIQRVDRCHRTVF